MAAETMSSTMAAPQKVSRYRSVRRAQEQQSSSLPVAPPLPATPTVPETQTHQDAPLSRSKSRYHRRPTESHATRPSLPTVSANATLATASSAFHRAMNSPQHASQKSMSSQYRSRTVQQPSESSPPVPHPVRQHSPSAEDNARQILEREKERQRLVREKMEAEAHERREVRRLHMEESERQQQAQQEEARQQAEREVAEAEALRRQQEETKVERERGSRLRKAESRRAIQQREEEAKRAQPGQQERQRQLEEKACRSSSPTPSPPRQHVRHGLLHRRKNDGLNTEDTGGPPRLTLGLSEREGDLIRPGGGGAVLGIDAPTSAVNAGDRRVTIVCGEKRIQLPVKPTTTPLDLIRSAATVLTEPIDIRTAAVSELFIRVLITRPLRNYEYVRDVMNSWDYDQQNELRILDARLDGIDQDDLLSYQVPDKRPGGMSCYISYSSKPGKWTKKWLVIRPDGQIVMAKNEKGKEKDYENVCTITDYDIYSVTQQKLAKVKPPKKMCYAVKSMQKSNIFADESQYVHFFCTNDKAVATSFYKTIQSWRSWYLKHQKGEGLKKKTAPVRKTSVSADAALKASTNVRDSIASHYQLGAFSNLLDLDDFNKRLDTIGAHTSGESSEEKEKASSRVGTQAMHARKLSRRAKHNPPISSKRAAFSPGHDSQASTRQDSNRQSFDAQDEETFATGGLLGRTYTQRQAQAQAHCREQDQCGPFTEGPSLLNHMGWGQASTNEGGLKRNTSVRSNYQRVSSDAPRSPSQRIPGMPAPLVDLTPQYRPPPQHANKGRGYNPGHAAGPLIESATSVQEAIEIPSSYDWRSHGSARGNGRYGSSTNNRTRSLKERGQPLAAYTQNNHAGVPEDDGNAFTGGGLLAQTGFSQGHAPVGRGVMDGSKAKGPMMDLGDEKPFAQGSLLSALPNTNGPLIDRSGR